MDAPRHDHASPLSSFATVPTARRSPSTMEMAPAIWSWSRGRQRRSLRERFAEARKVDEIAEQLEDFESTR